MMVFMCSQERIDNLPFDKPTGQVQKADVVVVVDGVMVVRLANGRFISSARDIHKWAYPISSDKVFREPVIRGLQKIGVITKAEADAHMAEHRKARAARQREWHEEMLRKSAEHLGLGHVVAQAMEARRAETGTGSVSDSAAPEGNAP